MRYSQTTSLPLYVDISLILSFVYYDGYATRLGVVSSLKSILASQTHRTHRIRQPAGVGFDSCVFRRFQAKGKEIIYGLLCVEQ